MQNSEEVQEEIDEAEELKAHFCLSLNVSPSEYDEMTPHQIGIWVDVYNKIQKKNSK